MDKPKFCCKRSQFWQQFVCQKIFSVIFPKIGLKNFDYNFTGCLAFIKCWPKTEIFIENQKFGLKIEQANIELLVQNVGQKPAFLSKAKMLVKNRHLSTKVEVFRYFGQKSKFSSKIKYYKKNFDQKKSKINLPKYRQNGASRIIIDIFRP
mgnify:CR=1 FL=1